jgi:hypothetical protein
VVGKDPVELEKYFEKKIALPEEHISTLILFDTFILHIHSDKILFYVAIPFLRKTTKI